MQPAARSPYAALGAGDPALIGGYRVLARIGAGRRGPVYLAQTQSGRRLAIKTVHPELVGDREFRERFKQELAAAQRVRGPFLAAVVDGHAEGPSPWVASEYVAGPSLARAVEEAGPLPVDAVRGLLVAAAEALATLHDADVVHGALRPSNVLLAEGGPRVVDFGAGDEGAGRDVLALGRLALFAATGDEDFSQCPDELREPVGRCLAADPAKRPEPRALIAELEEAPPGPGWLPSEVAALLPVYEADPPRPEPAPLPRPAPTFEPPGPPGPQPNFALPVGVPPTIPDGVQRSVPPVMDSYRHDLAIALGIGGGAFGLLVLILLLVFLL